MYYKSEATANKIDVSIGLTEKIVNGKRQWTWIDETTVDYANWAKGYPKQAADTDKPRCGTFVTDQRDHKLNGQWKHVDCTETQARAVCTQEPGFEFSAAALKNMQLLRVRKTQQRKPTRGERPYPI